MFDCSLFLLDDRFVVMLVASASRGFGPERPSPWGRWLPMAGHPVAAFARATRHKRRRPPGFP